MTRTVTIAVDCGPVVFPARCVRCGAQPTAESRLAFAKVVTVANGSQSPVQRHLAVPHCTACARATKAVSLAALVPFALGFLAAGGAAFAVTAFGAMRWGLDDVGRPHNANSLVLGAAAGLAGGLAGGVVAELVARVVLWPFFGRALWRAPLLAATLVTDVDYVAGVSGRPNADLSAVTLTFERDDIAAAVTAANARIVA